MVASVLNSRPRNPPRSPAGSSGSSRQTARLYLVIHACACMCACSHENSNHEQQQQSGSVMVHFSCFFFSLFYWLLLGPTTTEKKARMETRNRSHRAEVLPECIPGLYDPAVGVFDNKTRRRV